MKNTPPPKNESSQDRDPSNALLYINTNINHKKRYRFQNKKRKKILLWPVFILVPIFLTSVIVNMIVGETPKESTNTDDTQKEIEKMLDEIKTISDSLPHPLPEEIYQNIARSPQLFVNDLNRMMKLTDKSLLILVDKQHSLPDTYEPTDLVELDNYKDILTLNKKNMTLRNILIESLIALAKSAKQENIILPISSAYRSYNYQKTVFNRLVKTLGEKQARRESAFPGTSQHQLGTTMDFGTIDASFAETEAGKWLAENAWKLGFSLSFPKDSEDLTGYIYESWHYRYMGIPATNIEALYFNGYQQYMLEFIHYIPTSSTLFTLPQ